MSDAILATVVAIVGGALTSLLAVLGGNRLREAGVEQFHGWDLVGYVVFLSGFGLIAVGSFSLASP